MSDIKFIVPIVDQKKFNSILVPSITKMQCQCIQINDKPEHPKETIFKKYSGAIQILLQNGVKDDDILVFTHEDVAIIDNQFVEKIEYLFREKNDVGLVGVVGSTELNDNGGWWMNSPDKLRGHLMQGKSDGKIGEAFHLQKGAVGYFDDIVCIDGCMMITQGRFIREGIAFDNVTFDGHNDFYDIDTGLQFLERGYKIAVADILIYHNSPGLGSLKEPWQNAKNKMLEKWTNKGYKIPLTLDQFKIKKSCDEMFEIEI